MGDHILSRRSDLCHLFASLSGRVPFMPPAPTSGPGSRPDCRGTSRPRSGRPGAWPDELAGENEALRQRLSRLSEASLRISESLDFDNVLQGVLDSARSLTGARYGVITLLDDGGRIQDFITSGMSPEERQFDEFPNGMPFFERLSSIDEPLRLRDFHSHARELGLPEFRPPMAVSSPLTFLAAPLRHQGEGIGGIYVGEKEREFTAEDEETLVNTTPVGVLVFDARMGGVVSLNREARRIVSGLCAPGGSAELLWSGRMSRNRRARELRGSHRASAPPGTPAIIPPAWAAAAPGFISGMPTAAAAWTWIMRSASPTLLCTIAPAHHLPGESPLQGRQAGHARTARGQVREVVPRHPQSRCSDTMVASAFSPGTRGGSSARSPGPRSRLPSGGPGGSGWTG